MRKRFLLLCLFLVVGCKPKTKISIQREELNPNRFKQITPTYSKHLDDMWRDGVDINGFKASTEYLQRIISNNKYYFVDGSNWYKHYGVDILMDYDFILITNSKTIKIDNHNAYGVCIYEPDNIIVVCKDDSQWLDLTNSDKIIIHEMAHALASDKGLEGKKHGREWTDEVRNILTHLVDNPEDYIKDITGDRNEDYF